MLLSLIGRLVQFALAIVSIRVLSATLTPDQMALWSLLTTATSLFALLLVNPVGMFINRKLNDWIANGRDRTNFHMFAAYVVGVAVVAAVVLLYVNRTPYWPSQLPLLEALVVITATIITNSCLQTLVPSLNLVGRVRSFVVLNSLSLLLSLGLSIAVTRLWQPTAAAWLLGTILGQSAVIIVSYQVFFAKKARWSPHTLTRGKLVAVYRFCWPIALSVGLGWVHYQGYRFYLAETYSLHAFGLFAAGYGLAASLLSALEQVLATWFQPRFYRSISAKSSSYMAWPEYATGMLPASLFGGIAAIALAPHVIALLLAPQYQACLPYFQAGVVAELTRIAVGVYSLHAHSTMQTRGLLPPYAFGAGTGLVCVVSLSATHLGLVAAPIGVALGGVVAVIGLVINMGVARTLAHQVTPLWRTLGIAAMAGALVLAICICLRHVVSVSSWVEHAGFIACVGIPSAWTLYSLVQRSLTADL